MKFTRVFFFFVILFEITAGFFSCGGDPKNLSVSAPELLEMVRKDNSLARKADFSSIDVRAYILSRPGAAYYLACGLEDLGMETEADMLLEKTFQYDTGPWRREAGRRLASRMEADGSRPMNTALRYQHLYPEDSRTPLIMMKAFWLSGALLDLLRLAEEFTARIPEGSSPHALGEALLYRARAESGLNHPRFPETIRQLFYSCPVSPVHQEAWNSFFAQDGDQKFFSQDELDFFKAKINGAGGAGSAVLAAYKKQSFRAAGDPVFLREYADLLQKAAGWRNGIEELKRLFPSLRADASLVCEEYLGRFYRQGGQYDKSAAAFQNALNALGNRADIFPVSETRETRKDRLIWYLLSSTLRVSPKKMLAALPDYFSAIEDPAYFSDLFESLASALVRARDWESLASLMSLLPRRSGYERESARCAFLLASAVQANLYSPPPGRLPETRELFEYALANGEIYYRILSGLILKKDASGGQSGELGFFLLSPGEKPGEDISPCDSEEDAYVRGFLDFGLSRRAVRAARGSRHSISVQTLVRVAENEALEGRYIETLRLLHRASRRPGLIPDTRTLEALYPLAFAEEMRSAIADTDLPPALFYGLVREESYFDPQIGSHAGAVGLAQLMPATAHEIALKLKIPSPRLTDPLTNLRLGSYYLHAQRERFGEGAAALAAYNAGANRTIRWKKQFEDFPGVLFAEALTLSETREYIRKVLVSAVHYGYLYYQKTPRQTVREIFKDFS
jgi:hypothetical protein